MVRLTAENISRALTIEVLNKAFQQKTNSDDEIVSMQVQRAAAAGEGLLSAVYRVKISGKRHDTSFVIKGLINDALLRRSMNVEKYFKREIHFFEEVLPTLIDFQKSVGAKERLQNNIPNCYGFYINGNDDYIVLEDLSESGCTTAPERPNEAEKALILNALAHLHAVSMALRIKQPQKFMKLAHSVPDLYYTEENRQWYAKYLQNAISIDLNVMAEIEDPNTSLYYKKFDELLKNDVYSQMMRATVPSSHAVLCHGDCWFLNYLCSKDRAVAIDFQLLRFTSPALDLSVILMLSGDITFDKHSFVAAIKCYYDSLVYYLNDLGIEAEQEFSWKDLNDELELYGKFGLLAALTTIPLICSERFDTLQTLETMYSDKTITIPLEELWKLSPIQKQEQKMLLVNAVRMAVDFGYI